MNASGAFETFAKEAPAQQAAWMDAARKLEVASAFDKKTKALAYIAVLAALHLESGLSFHVKAARANGATRDEIISAVLARASGRGKRRPPGAPDRVGSVRRGVTARG